MPRVESAWRHSESLTSLPDLPACSLVGRAWHKKVPRGRYADHIAKVWSVEGSEWRRTSRRWPQTAEAACMCSRCRLLCAFHVRPYKSQLRSRSHCRQCRPGSTWDPFFSFGASADPCLRKRMLDTSGRNRAAALSGGHILRSLTSLMPIPAITPTPASGSYRIYIRCYAGRLSYELLLLPPPCDSSWSFVFWRNRNTFLTI
jgi:hypothetical protein